MFQGETAITIDDKGRMTIPTAYRELVASACGNRLVVTYDPFESGVLWLFPPKVHEALREQVLKLPGAKEVHRAFKRKLVGSAAEVEIDASSRLLLPASQRAAAGIEKRAVLLGMGERFELWSEQAHLAKVRETVEESQLTDELLALRF